MKNFKIEKSPILNKYGVFDLSGKQIIPFKYDTIFHIFNDNYFIVGNLSTFSIDHTTEYSRSSDYYKRYIYGLLDINGNTIIEPYSEILWLKDNFIITTYDGITNIRNFSKQYLWRSQYGNIYLNDHIVYQSEDTAVVKVWCDKIPNKYCGGFKYLVYNTDMEIIKEIFSFKEVLDNIIYKKTPWRDLINIYPEIGFIAPPKWEKFHFTESDCRDDNRLWGNLEVNGQHFSLIKDFHLFNNHFMQIVLKDGSLYLFNDTGKIIYKANSEVYIQTMGYCLDRLVINGTFILDTNGTRYQIESKFRHMKKYDADGNGFIKVIDAPNVDMSINMYSMKYKYIGIMDIYGREIVPPIFPRPVYSNTYVEAHGTPWSNIADPSDAFDGVSDAYWNID